jgi:hypothetical protein
VRSPDKAKDSIMSNVNQGTIVHLDAERAMEIVRSVVDAYVTPSVSQSDSFPLTHDERVDVLLIWDYVMENGVGIGSSGVSFWIREESRTISFDRLSHGPTWIRAAAQWIRERREES